MQFDSISVKIKYLIVEVVAVVVAVVVAAADHHDIVEMVFFNLEKNVMLSVQHGVLHVKLI
jgi:hypothetical protein